MTEAIPIRPDVEPTLDIEREMADHVRESVRDYIAENGGPPVTIAFVLIGPDDGAHAAIARSWSPGNEQRSRLQACATAAAVLMKRALGL